MLTTKVTTAWLTLAAAASALPTVTVVPLEKSCASYPGFNSETGRAGPFTVAADSTGKSIDGNKVTSDMYWTPEATRYGFAIVPEAAGGSNITLRCSEGRLQAEVDMGAEAGRQWQPIVVSGDPNWQASLGWSFPEDDRPVYIEPYAHLIEGERVPGVFLGARNVTTWTFKQNFAGVYGTHFLVRLGAPPAPGPVRPGTLGSRQLRQEPDFAGFLKIAA